MNKKNLLILKISLLSIIALGLLYLMFSLISIDWSFKGFEKRKEYKLVMSEQYNVTDVKKINFDLRSADLDINYSDSNEIKLEIYDKDESKFYVNLDQEVLNVKFNKSSICIGFCYTYRKAVIYLPNDYAGELEINTASGDIDIMSFINSDMNVNTASGDIKILGSKSLSVKTASGEVEVSDVDNLKVKTVSGDIELNNIGNIEGSTTSGEIEVYSLKHFINFSSVSGDINLKNVFLDKNSKLSTVSGDVEIEGINRVYINTSTTSGDVDVVQSDRKSEIELIIKTTSGDIEVE